MEAETRCDILPVCPSPKFCKLTAPSVRRVKKKPWIAQWQEMLLHVAGLAAFACVAFCFNWDTEISLSLSLPLSLSLNFHAICKFWQSTALKCFNEADNNYCMRVLKCQSTKRNKPHLHVPCHAKVTILGSILTGSSCFVFVFSWDVIKFQFPAPEHLLGNRSRSFLFPLAMMWCPLSMPWLKCSFHNIIYISNNIIIISVTHDFWYSIVIWGFLTIIAKIQVCIVFFLFNFLKFFF